MLLALGVMSLPTPPVREILSIEWVEAPKPAESVKPTSRPQDRIVESKKVAPSKEAEPDAFLGEQTQTVSRQTMSTRELSDKYNSKQKGAAASPQAAAKPVQARAPSPAKTDQAKPKLSALTNLGMDVFEARARKPAAEPQDNARTANRAPASVGDPGGAAPSEYVKGLSQGQETLLNTKEYVFFSYYKRIRESLDRAWNANLKENLTKLQYRGRTLASQMDHLTRLLVTLDSAGQVVAVQVLEESGTRDLDDAAIRAFKKAGPFPNPPNGLLDQAGRVVIRWEFILKT
jgi:TonB family protein